MLTHQFVAFITQQEEWVQPPNPCHVDKESTEDDLENSFLEDQFRKKEMGLVENNGSSKWWESGLRIDIPEFQGSLQPEGFLDWVSVVEKVLDFKEVPNLKRVSFVVTRFHGLAAAWLQQSKLTQVRQRKKIYSWEKLKKHIRVVVLSHNHMRMMYQNLQNLCQGSCTVDE